MGTRAIVVGADGTGSSRAAVRWAAREAERRHLPLRIVHTFEWNWREARSSSDSGYADMVWRIAESVTATAFDQAHEVAPATKIERDTLIGHAAPRLLAIAGDADILVLGNRGRGGFASLLLGSVSQRVATHAPCPVVIVRGRGDVTDGPIAVGVDDSPAAERILETAFEAARSRECGLQIVRSYLAPVPLWLRDDMPRVDVEPPELDAGERSRLEELVAPWQAKYPEVTVEVTLSHDSAASILVGASHSGQLVVVGSHGHGVVAGALLGSTSLQLLHHADCPVYIARSDRSGTESR
jgi:nucleotide-binding universal stress UspA family protein